MAVEIPVVVDIDKAFEDAANRVSAAMRPLKQKIDDKGVLELKFKTTVDKTELDKLSKEIRETAKETEEGMYVIERSFEQLWANGKPKIDDLRSALASFKTSLNAKWNNGADMSAPEVQSLQKAIILMEEYLNQRNRAVSLTEQQYYKELQSKRAEEERNFIIAQEAKTTAEMAERISALRGKLANVTPGGKEWRETAKEIEKATAAMEKYEQKYIAVTTKPGSINRMTAEMRKLEEQWNSMSRAQKFDADGNLKKSAQKVVDKFVKLTETADKFGKSLAETAKGAETRTKELGRSVREVNMEMERSNSKLGNIIKNSLRLLAIHSASTFVRNIREVTAEFELQRVALGSIIQDTERAESLFKQIKAAAVESPFEIKDLVTYTKQLSAYQIETDKLFDTTKKLADISAGLGVDMGRLILAFGQVRAAAVLRGQELRQFTEAGIPLVDKLAQKFTELNGRAVSTAEVFELISKRAVPFSMIEEIFNDLTSAGGAFYKMQEKQAETLLGQWNNLKDSISIMYDEIGNTAVVHDAMEFVISSAKTIMQNWRQIADVVKIVGIQYGVMKAATLFLPTLTRNTKLLEKAEIAEARAKQLSNAAHRNKFLELSAKNLRAYTYYTILASRATTQWARSINMVKAFLSGNWLSIALTILGLAVAKIVAARNETERLNKELSKIGAEGSLKMEQSVRNFEKLARAAVEAADGSKEQKDAVDELTRTYGDILPPSDKLIDKLKEMEGNYTSLTEAIRQKINMQIREQQIDEVTSEYSTKISRKRDRLKKFLKEQGLSSEEISAVLAALQSAVNDGLIKVGDSFETQAKAIEKIISDYTGKYIKLTKSAYSQVAGQGATQVYTGEQTTKLSRAFSKIIDLYSGMNDKIQEVEDSMVDATGVIGVYSREWKDLQDELSGFSGIGATKFAKNESKIKNRVDKSIEFLQKKFNEAEIDISAAIANGTPDFTLLEQIVEDMKSSPAQASLRSIIANFKKEYEKIVPDDKIREASKQAFMEISESMGISMDKLSSYIKAAGQDSKEYLKELKESADKYFSDADEMERHNATFRDHISVPLYTSDQIEEQREMGKAIQFVVDLLSKVIALETKAAGRDNHLQQIRQQISDVTDAYKKFLELRNYMSKKDALSNIDILFPSLKGWEPTYENMVSRLEGMLNEYRGDADATRIIEQAIANIKFDKLKTDMDNAIKKLADDIKQSEAAKRFFEDIFQATGDREIATNLTMSVYGNVGDDLEQKLRDQLSEAFVLDETALAAANKSLAEASSEVAQAIIEDDYVTLSKYLEYVTDANRDNAKNLLKDRMDANAAWYKDFIQTYKKAADYQAQINTLNAQRETEKAKARSKGATEADLAAIDKYFNEKIAGVEVEALKNTYEWGKAFEDLDRVGIKTLRNLREQILKIIEAQKEFLTPEQLRTLEQALERIKVEDAGRDPITAIRGGFRSAMMARMGMAAQSTGNPAVINAARIAIEKFNEAADTTVKLDFEHLEDGFNDANVEMQDGIEGVKTYVEAWESAIDAISEAFNLDEVPILGETLQGVSDALSFIAGILPVIITLNNILNGTLMMNPIIAAGAAVVATIGAIVGLIKGIINAKIEKLNKEFERQEKIIKQLEKSYDRLDKAIEKSFGNELVYNYNQQLENLQAKHDALIAQMENREQAARNESTKKNRERYEQEAQDAKEQAQEVQAQIQDMPYEISASWLGEDLASAAESFADAWLSAYEEFGDTAGAIEERMEEMVKNIIKKAALSGIAQNIMGNWYSSLADVQDWNAQTIAEKWREAMALVDPMVQGMQGFANAMQAEGQSLRSTSGQLTGISRDIAGASEESITGLAAGINTQNFYMSLISQNVAAILQSMTGGEVQGATGVAVPDSYKETVLLQMENLPLMRDDMYAIRSMLEKVIRPNGTTATHYVATKM